MEISERLKQISGSATALIFAKAKDLEAEGRDIIHLEIGQPDYAPPDVVIEATIQALREKKTTYTVSRGIAPLRERIAEYHKEINGTSLDFKTEVIITSGAKLGIFSSLWSVVNPGDNVVVLNPSWVSYGDIIRSLGAEPRYLAVDMEFNFNEDELQNLVNDKTKALILNSPSNPTGGVVSKKNLQDLVKFCRSHDILIVSDEIYNDYLYEGATHHSLLDIEDWRETGVVVNGFSKSFSMTGYRLGYVLGSSKIINQVNKVMQLTASCPVNFAQHAAITALDHIDEMKQFINTTMNKRRDLVIEMLNEIGVEFTPPKGAIYAWFKIPSQNSVEWAGKLLEEQGVALTPGSAFGPDGESYARICFATDIELLREGIKRIGTFINSS